MSRTYEEVGRAISGGNQVVALKQRGEAFHDMSDPAFVAWYSDGRLRHQIWFRDGRRHCDDGPSHISYEDDGNIWRELWYRHDKKHRDDGPAEIVYDTKKVLFQDRRSFEELRNSGAVRWESWYRNDKLHRDGKPAEFWYHEDGSLQHEAWRVNGFEHREDGPALIYYSLGEVFSGDTRSFEQLKQDGAVQSSEWYNLGVEVGDE